MHVVPCGHWVEGEAVRQQDNARLAARVAEELSGRIKPASAAVVARTLLGARLR